MTKQIPAGIVKYFVTNAIANYQVKCVENKVGLSNMFPAQAFDVIEKAIDNAFTEFEQHGHMAGLTTITKEETNGETITS